MIWLSRRADALAVKLIARGIWLLIVAARLRRGELRITLRIDRGDVSADECRSLAPTS
jgi:hypothetical protein